MSHYIPVLHPAYRPGFYLLGAFRLLSLIVLYFINISFRRSPSGSLLKHTFRLLHNVELVALFLAMLLTGQSQVKVHCSHSHRSQSLVSHRSRHNVELWSCS